MNKGLIDTRCRLHLMYIFAIVLGVIFLTTIRRIRLETMDVNYVLQLDPNPLHSNTESASFRRKEDTESASFRREEDTESTSFRREEDTESASFRRKEDTGSASFQIKEDTEAAIFRRKDDTESASFQREEDTESTIFRRKEDTERASFQREEDTESASFRRKDHTESAIFRRNEDTESASFRRNEDTESAGFRRKEDTDRAIFRREEDTGSASFRRKEDTESASFRRNEDTESASFRRKEDTEMASFRREEDTESTIFRRKEDTEGARLRRKEDRESSSFRRKDHTESAIFRRKEDLYRQMTLSKPSCPMISPRLIGNSILNISNPTWEEVHLIGSYVDAGGMFQPRDCTARNKIAIIIPYREREWHLKVLLRHLHPFLQRQQHDYRIFVVEQDPSSTFNTGLMKNIGFVEASKTYDYDCYVFHDVDKVPEDDRNIYSCSNMPRHLAVAISKWGYKLPYEEYIGGVIAMTKHHFEAINGYSTIFFNWGGDDDEIRIRILSRHMTICRYSENVARYTSLSHPHDTPNDFRDLLHDTAEQRMKTDGLNSLSYTLLKTEYKDLYTRILVYINETEIMNKEPIYKLQKDIYEKMHITM